MQELDPYRKLILLKPEGARRVGKPELRWFESLEEDLRNMSVRNWSHKTENIGGQFWKKFMFTKDCNAGKRKRRIFQSTSHQPI
jgi:hypothetical protein